jgi:hemolysin activation/secretion protein
MSRTTKILHLRTEVPSSGLKTTLIPALRRQRQAVSESKASLLYRGSSRTVRAIQRNPVLKTNKQTNKQKTKRERERTEALFTIIFKQDLQRIPLPSYLSSMNYIQFISKRSILEDRT